MNRPMKQVRAIFAFVAILSSTVHAQWPKFATPSMPKTADGKVNLTAPAPRTPDGKPDLSGVWETIPGEKGRWPCSCVAAAGTGELPPSGFAFRQHRRPDSGRRAVSAVGGGAGQEADGRQQQGQPGRALPADGHHAEHDASVSEEDHPDTLRGRDDLRGSATTVREVFLDGRTLPIPTRNRGVGLLRRALGRRHARRRDHEFIDDDMARGSTCRGSPLTAQRQDDRSGFRRPNFGSLVIEVTIDDPKAYTKPFTATINNRLLSDTQLIEFVCIDKSAQHYVGSDGRPGQPVR